MRSAISNPFSGCRNQSDEVNTRMSAVHEPAPGPCALPHARPRRQSGLTRMSSSSVSPGLDRSASVSTLRGTEGSNPPSSNEESSTNPTFGCTSSDHAPVPIGGNGRPCQGDRWFESLYRSRSRSNSTPVSPTGEIRGPGIETYSRPEPILGFVKRRFALHTRYRVGERDPGIHAAVENRAAPFPGGSNRLHDS